MMAPKRLLALALALLFAVSFAAPSGARAESADGFTYTVSGSEATVTGCVGTCPTNLVIPSTLGGVTVTTIQAWAFRFVPITTLVLPPTLTTIGMYAFSACWMTSVDLPASITTIGQGGFRGNHLTTITLPPLLTYIDGYAFAGNDLTTLVIPNTVTAIAPAAFEINDLTSVTIAASVVSIGNGAFSNNLLTTVDFLGNAPTPGGPNIFAGNPSLTSVRRPASASGWNATWGGMPVVVANAFTYTVAAGSATITGCVATCPTVLTIPAALDGFPVTAIGDNAFSTKSLTSAVIPDSVTSIGVNAFYYNALTSVHLGSGVLTIGANAFFSNSLTSVTLPSSLTDIGAAAFIGNHISTVVIPDSVTSIGDYAFALNYSALTSLSLGSSVETIGNNAFANNALTAVVFPNSLKQIGAIAFADNLLSVIDIPSSVTSIGGFAFRDNPITRVKFFGNAPTEGHDVFLRDSGLTHVSVYASTSGWGATWSGVPVEFIDIYPPSSSATRLGQTPSSEEVVFVLTSDESATFECNLDDGGWSACNSSYTTPSLSDGTHVLLVRAIDTAGNVDPTPAREEWIVDTTPPETTLDATPGSTSTDAVGQFSFSGSDNVSSFTFECSVDEGSFAACTSPFNTATLGAGSHTFAVRAVDAAGRTDQTPAMHTWMIEDDQAGLPSTDTSQVLELLVALLVAAVSGWAGVRLLAGREGTTH